MTYATWQKDAPGLPADRRGTPALMQQIFWYSSSLPPGMPVCLAPLFARVGARGSQDRE